jgi:hypothetical protein
MSCYFGAEGDDDSEEADSKALYKEVRVQIQEIDLTLAEDQNVGTVQHDGFIPL